MKPIIRPANTEDIPAIHQLVKELAEYEKALHEFVATLEDYYNDFKNQKFEVIVAEIEKTVIGMVLFYPAYSTWKGKMMYLEDFVVTPDWRGKGIGKLLLNAFLQKAKDRGCVQVKWQVLDWNEPAIRFYQQAGAIIEQNWWNVRIVF
jgi:GNAT superfamily N-acetyltransferase